MDAVLNLGTRTIHKQEDREPDIETICGVTRNLPQDRFEPVTAIETELETTDASKCGRCFDDGGGY